MNGRRQVGELRLADVVTSVGVWVLVAYTVVAVFVSTPTWATVLSTFVVGLSLGERMHRREIRRLERKVQYMEDLSQYDDDPRR